MNAFVLSYTTDITMSVPLHKQPLEDISRAVRFIRKNASKYNIDGKKLVIMGFSAGSHVCGSLAVHFDDVIENNPEYADISNRPDGVILSYPVRVEFYSRKHRARGRDPFLWPNCGTSM